MSKDINESKGINGWLTPTGEFHSSEVARYVLFARDEIKKKKFKKEQDVLKKADTLYQSPVQFLIRQKGYILLWSRWSGSSVEFQIVNLEAVITEKQAEWLKENSDKLDDKQKRCVKRFLEV